MSDERRYDEDEVREIFEAAAEARESGLPAVSSGGGITLAELETIGEEVGLPAARVRQAAAALDATRSAAGPAPRRTYLGVPYAVGQTVDLPRAPTDQEWEILVAELRETFGARGSVDSFGRSRTWANGNLEAHVEPTESGYRLRLSTFKGDAGPRLGVGGVLVSMGLLLLVALLIKGRAAEAVAMFTFMGGFGGLIAGSTVLRLPGWASERERQMEYIAGRAVALIASPTTPDAGED